jgi:hypothetical protein
MLTLLFAKLRCAVCVLCSLALNSNIGVFMEVLSVCLGRLHFGFTKLNALNAEPTICMRKPWEVSFRTVISSNDLQYSKR